MAVASERDLAFMRRALALAKRAWGDTHPNPLVGALLVEEDEVVAEGWHAKDGGPHAERVALNALGRQPKPGAELFVTLEPCSTVGRTGSCCEAIVAAGVRRVVIGALDPNPVHAGRALRVLGDAGIEVCAGLLEPECKDLNLIFNHWITRDEPLFAGKVAVSLDGRIATRGGQSQWITGEASRKDVMRWRRLFPAIAVGAGTVLADNPRLTARPSLRGGDCIEEVQEFPVWQTEEAPVRFVFDGRLSTLAGKALPSLYTDAFCRRTVVVSSRLAALERRERLRSLGLQYWEFDTDTPRVPFAAFRRRCKSERLSGVFFEGGGDLLGSMLAQRELDYLYIYSAPLLFADEQARPAFGGCSPRTVAEVPRLVDIQRASHGEDSLVRGRIAYPEPGI